MIVAVRVEGFVSLVSGLYAPAPGATLSFEYTGLAVNVAVMVAGLVRSILGSYAPAPGVNVESSRISLPRMEGTLVAFSSGTSYVPGPGTSRASFMAGSSEYLPCILNERLGERSRTSYSPGPGTLGTGAGLYGPAMEGAAVDADVALTTS